MTYVFYAFANECVVAMKVARRKFELFEYPKHCVRKVDES